MFLKRLVEYSNRLDLPPEMYLKTTIRWIIDLDITGKLKSKEFISLTGAGKNAERGKKFYAPSIKRSNKIIPKLLADNGEYVLGIPREAGDAEKVKKRHEQFKNLIKICAHETKERTVTAVSKFLENWIPDNVHLPKDFNSSDNITFRINETVLPIDLLKVRSFWAEYTARITKKRGNKIMPCHICGVLKPAEERMPIKIKRVPGGKPSGTEIISANWKAAESYGLEHSLIAPTCRDCGERFAKSINTLIEEPQTHFTLGPLVYIFWTREESSFSPVSLLSKPEPEEVKALFTSVLQGKENASIDDTDFYAVGLSASGGRVVVRDFIETTIPTVKEKLRRWFTLQRLVDTTGTIGKPVGISDLARSLLPLSNRKKKKDNSIDCNIPQLLLRSALYGDALPYWLLFQAVRRNRNENWNDWKKNPHGEEDLYRRIVLIKMVLLSQKYINSQQKENEMEALDLSNREPAYLLGMLLAELEVIQRKVNPNYETTIIDRYYGSASSAPASIFGLLLSKSQNHLSKLKKIDKGAHNAIQQNIERILFSIPTGFPKTLDLIKQGLFSLGYYHQRAINRAAAMAHKEKKEQEGGENIE